MGRDAGLRKRRVRSYALGTSAIALGMMFSGSAAAQCAPGPTITNCTGTDTDGVTILTDNTRVSVASGAVVYPGDAAAGITIRARDAFVDVAGRVDGLTTTGILVTSGISVVAPCDPYAGASVGTCTPGTLVTYPRFGNATITVYAGGLVSGTNGIVFRRAAPDAGSVWGSVNNYGTITGTAGAAIQFTTDDYNGLTLYNGVSGTITGGIAGSISYVTNEGRIDGTSRAAIASTLSNMHLINSGSIVSSGTAPTVSATDYLNVTNEIGGTIGGSAIAISTTGTLVLANEGTIDGSVVSTAAAGQMSTIDTRIGTINGDLRLGAGNDTLRARYDPASGRVSSITGVIDGGAGTDTLAIGIDSDVTLAGVTLPTGFDLLGLDLSDDSTVTIAPGFTTGSGIGMSGQGTVINRAALVTPGLAVNSFGAFNITVINRGTITATLGSPGQYAVMGSGFLYNEGAITAIGGAGAMAGSLENSGTITATQLAAQVGSGALINSGEIRSTTNLAVRLYAGDFRSSNSGTIAGATIGLAMSGWFTNTGTISGGTTGVELSGTFANAAQGIVTGGTAAIATGGSAARVVNAGTINGTVDFTSPYSWDSSRDLFVDDGGVVNGAIRLGGGDDELVVTLGADSARALAGATGGVDAGSGYDTLRYRVAGDASATLALVGGFEGLAYELSNRAVLSLAATDPFVATIGLAGVGSVTLDGSLTATDRALVNATIPTVAQLTGTSGSDVEPSDLTIVNNGTLALATTSQNYFFNLGAIQAGTAAVTNNGSITVTSGGGNYHTASGISGGMSVVNAGTIALTGAGAAIEGAQDVVNSGVITATGINAAGVSGFVSFTNMGRISTDGVAVRGDVLAYGTLSNTGTIESRNAVALALGSYAEATNSGTIQSRAGAGVTLGYNASLVNEAGGTIRGAGVAIRGDRESANIINRGVIAGDVQLGSLYSWGRSTFVSEGGSVEGAIRFGSGADVYLQRGDTAGATGVIDGGDGNDLFGRYYEATADVAIGVALGLNFEQELFEARGTETIVTLTAGGSATAHDLFLGGEGRFVNRADWAGTIRLGQYYGAYSIPGLGSFTNEGAVGVVRGGVASFDNRGTITAVQVGEYDGYSDDSAINLSGTVGGRLSFTNSGTITGTNNSSGYGAVTIYRDGPALHTVTLDNQGTINGGIAAEISATSDYEASLSLTNAGSIGSTVDGGVAVYLGANASGYSTNPAGAMSAGAISLVNTGHIATTGNAGSAVAILGLDPMYGEETTPMRISVVNSGAIAAASGIELNGRAFGIRITGRPSATVTIVNLAGGTIAVGDTLATAISVNGPALALNNAGAITGGAGGDVSTWLGGPATYVAGAIQGGSGNDSIVNTGTITGSIALGYGDDRIENYGRIDGNAFLGAGDDTFLHRASAILNGTVDGGIGIDSLIVDATGGGTVNGDQFVNFERFSQTGEGNVTYAGTFRFETIGLAGGTISVADGETLESDGDVTVTGSDGAETLDNRGTIFGTVALGGGDDTYVDHASSNVVRVDGGSGTDLYRVILSGDRTGIAQRTGFERLAVQGIGTLTLALDQQFDGIALSGTGLNLTLGGYTIGQVTGSDLAETLLVDGDLGSVDLGSGSDVLALGTALAAGRYAGGAGNDTLRFTAAGPVTLAGTTTGFETIALTGGALTVSGTLDSTGSALGFGDGAQQLTIASGGVLSGTIDLGAGDDSLRLAAGSILTGTASGGAGTDSATLELTGNRTLTSGTLTDFELLASEGNGTLTLADTHAYQRIVAGTDLALTGDAAVSAGQVQFGARDDRFTIAGRFAGSIDGGAGNDTLAISGGTAAAPVAIGNLSNVERYVQAGGFVTVAGIANLGVPELAGGRLVGLAGSIITASQINVAPGATFGSAGAVNGNLTVAGTLSPGASIGTMTVNGNVTLAAGSVSLFEIGATSADRLQVNGALSIASGATLQLAPSGTIRPGVSYDLIVASGGISGRYGTVLKPDSLFGFVIQRSDRIQLLGQFLGGAGFAPQAARSIDYANATLQLQPATSSLFSALPALLNADGSSNARAFAQLTPEAYASATQAGVDNALTLTGAARGPAFTTSREEAGPFTFGQIVGQWHTLGADAGEGTAAARTRGHGFLGGIGYGNTEFSIGAFGGYLDTRQTIGALGAETKNDGFVGGVHARYAANGLGLTASVLYDGGEAHTVRALPGASRATGRYDLHSWVADVSVSYALDMGAEWSLRPRAGVTYLRTTRDAVNEAGGPFALQVARDRHIAGFVDGGVMLARSDASADPFRPFVSLGVRYQVEGRRTDGLAGYAGGPLALTAFGASRAQAVGTAAVGASYRLTAGLELFSTASAQTGRDDHQESITTGVRLRF